LKNECRKHAEPGMPVNIATSFETILLLRIDVEENVDSSTLRKRTKFR
jgi:hypothetical protein